MEHYACPTFGSCQGLYTANTLACLTEVMGMSLPGCATAAAVSSKKRRIAFDSGYTICDLIKNNVLPRDIVTIDAIKNASVDELSKVDEIPEDIAVSIWNFFHKDMA